MTGVREAADTVRAAVLADATDEVIAALGVVLAAAERAETLEAALREIETLNSASTYGAAQIARAALADPGKEQP